MNEEAHDDEIRPDWRPQLGRRAFQLDAFLSHNRGDGSAFLVGQLNQHGARAWHDRDADVADRNVQLHLQINIRSSRYVVVCVGPRFRESDWCRAEYLPALSIGRRVNATRVIVAKLSEDATVPEALAACPVFICNDAGLREMAEFLIEGNTLPFNPETDICPQNLVLDADEKYHPRDSHSFELSSASTPLTQEDLETAASIPKLLKGLFRDVDRRRSEC